MIAEGGGFGRATRNGAIAGLVVVVIAAAAFAFVPALRPSTPERVSRFLLVIAGPGEDGAMGARIIAEVDLGAGGDSGGSSGNAIRAKVTALDPAQKVSIAGTTYDRLADAYAFGGGAGVAAAAYSEGASGGNAARRAAASGARTEMPYVALTFEQFARTLSAVSVDIPRDMEVFTGDELISFREGPTTVTPEEAIWLLEGAAYLPASERDEMREQVAREVLEALSQEAGGIAGLVERGEAESDVGSNALPSSAIR